MASANATRSIASLKGEIMRSTIASIIAMSLVLVGCNNKAPQTIGELMILKPELSEAIDFTDSISTLSKDEKKWLAAYLVQGNASNTLDENLTLTDAATLQKDTYVRDSIEDAKKYAAIISQLPRKGIYEHPYKITTEYDKFKDYSTLKINDLPITRSIDISLYETYSGKFAPNTLPRSVNCMITSSTDSWEFLTSHDVTFLLNNDVRLHYETSHDGTVGSGYVLEFLTFDIPIEDLIQIANATSVEIQIFTTEGKLATKQLNGIKDFLSRLVP